MFTMQERQGLAIWVYSLKQVRRLRRYGMIYYISRRMRYVVMYVDQKKASQLMASLRKLNFVRKVEPSPRKSFKFNQGQKLEQKAAAESSGEH